MKLFGCLLTLMLALPSLQIELKILSLPSGHPIGPAPCALTCSGVSSFGETGSEKWNGSGFAITAYKIIDITECGFSSPPVVTAMLSGISQNCPSISVFNFADKTKLAVFTVQAATADQMISNLCDVYWTANGYSC